ncbi:MAG: acyclic terpene utilization AtuA family protein [Acidobacteriota bacterium]
MNEVLRIANCSGFYGDRLAAAREMVEGGPIDVLTGDYLAELTMTILAKDRRGDPSLGYAKTFPIQLRGIAATCLERNIKIVVNAGGLNPAGCADVCRGVYRDLGLDARVAHIEGDDLLPRLPELRRAGETFTHLDRGVPLDQLEAPLLTANAYLGGWGIAAALGEGADLVICPRVTDASLVVGPAAWRFGWKRDDWDPLASALVAGHVLECGAQATGGNYAFFDRVPGLERPGFPIAEIEADGTFTVTKHPGSGGEVSVGTVTAQLLYEIGGPRYLNPDVTARFDSIRLLDDGPGRVRVEGVQGEPPPTTTKVGLTYAGGFKNQVTFVLGGLDVDAKAALAEKTLWGAVGGRDTYDETRVTLHRGAAEPENGGSTSFLTVAVKDPDPRRVGRAFSGAAVEMALASYPGFNLTAPPGKAAPFAVFWPALVQTDALHHRVVMDDRVFDIPHTPGHDRDPVALDRGAGAAVEIAHGDGADGTGGDVVDAPLGLLVGARSGDKGGNANLGVWVEEDPSYRWLESWLTVRRLKDLLPEARTLRVERHPLPNLRALNFVLYGLLGDGVAASLAPDPQAKGLGEQLRSKIAPIPQRLLPRDIDET